MIVIAHRGASGVRPEHTLEAYRLAVEQGADYIEPDLVLTRDGVLIARHENEIGGTTDVADRREFADRKRTQMIDGQAVTGWFSEDFTLAEIRMLRARERLPRLRPASRAFDGRFVIPTFAEILALTAALDATRLAQARLAGCAPPAPIGVYPETKHPGHFARLGLDFQAPLLAELERHGRLGADSRIFVQSFEVENLRRLHAASPELPLVQLLNDGGAPADLAAAGYAGGYREMATPAGLAAVAAYARAVGVAKSMVIPLAGDGGFGAPTSLVADAHAAGLAVHVWTFRAENHFLPRPCRIGSGESAYGDLGCELRRFIAAGVDGVFADQPDLVLGLLGR